MMSYYKMLAAMIVLLGLIPIRRWQVELHESLHTLQIFKDVSRQEWNGQFIHYFPPPKNALDTESCAKFLDDIDSQRNTFLGEDNSRLNNFNRLACLDDNEIVQLVTRQASVPKLTSGLTLHVGEILNRNNKSDEALALWKQYPKISNYFGYLGRLAIEQNQNEAFALEKFRLAYLIDSQASPYKQEMYLYACLISVREGYVVVGKHPCQDFHAIQPNALSYFLLGRTFHLNEAFHEAQPYFSQAIYLEPSNGDYYYWAAKNSIVIDSLLEAYQFALNGTIQDPNYVWNYLLLSNLDLRAGDTDAAIDILQEALSIAQQEKDELATTRILESLDELKHK
ncbi:MAG: tetratricopeptide repeat protein [Chloroflexota bacterium]